MPFQLSIGVGEAISTLFLIFPHSHTRAALAFSSHPQQWKEWKFRSKNVLPHLHSHTLTEANSLTRRKCCFSLSKCENFHCCLLLLFRRERRAHDGGVGSCGERKKWVGKNNKNGSQHQQQKDQFGVTTCTTSNHAIASIAQQNFLHMLRAACSARVFSIITFLSIFSSSNVEAADTQRGNVDEHFRSLDSIFQLKLTVKDRHRVGWHLQGPEARSHSSPPNE